MVQAAQGHVRTVRTSVFDLIDEEQVEQLSAICKQVLDGLDPQHRLVGHA